MVKISSAPFALAGLAGLAQADYFCNKEEAGKCTIAYVQDNGHRYYQIYDNNCNKISGQMPGHFCTTPYGNLHGICIDSQLPNVIIADWYNYHIFYGKHYEHYNHKWAAWGNTWVHSQAFSCT